MPELIARTGLLRAGIVCAIMILAWSETVPDTEWALAALVFLLGSAEVMRDNAAQTILLSIVPADDLGATNGQMGSAEQITDQFIGPLPAGLLIGAGIALPLPAIAGRIGAQSSLCLALAVWTLGYAVVAMSSSATVAAPAMFALMAGAMPFLLAAAGGGVLLYARFKLRLR